MSVLDLNETLDEMVTIDNLLKFNYAKDEWYERYYNKQIYGYFLDHHIPIIMIRVQVFPSVRMCRILPLIYSETLLRSELGSWQHIETMEDLMLFESKVEILINEEYGRQSN